MNSPGQLISLIAMGCKAQLRHDRARCRLHQTTRAPISCV